MDIFIDTPAFFAIIDADDSSHKKAASRWVSALESDDHLVTTNYVVLETTWLLQKRLGMDSVRDFFEKTLPCIDVIWVDERLHAAGVAALLTSDRRSFSLADCVSFETMRSSGIRTAFSFDRHFNKQGFETIP